MYIERDKTKQIQSHLFSPHYTNESFRRMKTVFLAKGYKTKLVRGYDTVECKGIEYNYDDRIRQWDWENAQACWEQIKTTYTAYNSAEVHEQYLRLYFDDPTLQLVHIMTGVNWSNGYYYRVYGYTRNNAVTPAPSSPDSAGTR